MKFPEAVLKSITKLSSPEFEKRVEEEDPSMKKHIPILLELNRHGYITVNSQAGNHFKGVNSETKKKYDYSEKAFILGFMLQSTASVFIKELALHTDKLAQVLHATTDKQILELPIALDLPLTMDRMSGVVHSHMPNTVSVATWDAWRKECHIDKSEKIVHVMCYDLQWNRNASGPGGLFKDVLRILKKINRTKNKTVKKK
jgi:hypothetical protein